jgi:hypothetical protein
VAAAHAAVVSGAAGSYIVTLTGDAGISTDLVIEPGQDVHISGDPGLAVAPSWGSGGFTVQERGSLSLSTVVISGVLSVTEGQLNLASVEVPSQVLGDLLANRRDGQNGLVTLRDVSFSDHSAWQHLTGTWSIEGGAHSSLSRFEVVSGPCTTSQGGRCVGRPDGYGPDESCEIAVRMGGALADCPVFETVDYISMAYCGGFSHPDRRDTVSIASSGEQFSGWDRRFDHHTCLGGDCTIDAHLREECDGNHPGVCNLCPPAGTVLATGDSVTWNSHADLQCAVTYHNEDKLSSSMAGWELCFA